MCPFSSIVLFDFGSRGVTIPGHTAQSSLDRTLTLKLIWQLNALHSWQFVSFFFSFLSLSPFVNLLKFLFKCFILFSGGGCRKKKWKGDTEAAFFTLEQNKIIIFRISMHMIFYFVFFKTHTQKQFKSFRSFHIIFYVGQKRLTVTCNTHVECDTLCQHYLWLLPVMPLLVADLLYCSLEYPGLFNGWKICKTTNKRKQLVIETVNVIETGF